MLKNWKKHLRYAPDDAPFKFGTGGTAQLLWETADANANALVLALPDGTTTDVPVLVVGDQSVLNADLTWFNGVTQPRIALVDADGDAWIALGYRVDDLGGLLAKQHLQLVCGTNGIIYMFPGGQTTRYLQVADANNVITLLGTGAYLRIGNAGTTGHSLASEDDLMVSGKLEVKGVSFMDDDFTLASAKSIIGAGTGANGIVLKNLKNTTASALSGTQLDVEIDIGGTPYHFTVYPTKAG